MSRAKSVDVRKLNYNKERDMQFNIERLAADRTRLQAKRPNELWTNELVWYRSSSSGKVLILVVLDAFSGVPQLLDLTTGSVGDFVLKLENACRSPGYPMTLLVDQDFEFRSQELQEWASAHGVELLYGASFRKASIARPFLLRLRNECLRDLQSPTIADIESRLESWRRQYNA
jgi:hypothetical protein